MKRISTTILWVLAVALLIGAGLNQRELDRLRAQSRELASEPAGKETVAVAESSSEPMPDTVVPPELLQLRNEVSQLMAQKRNLRDFRADNQQLVAAIAARGTYAPVLPQDYLRTRDAKWVGMSTPENTLQSFLWALANRDFAVLTNLCTPEVSDRIKLHPADLGNSPLLPGARISKQQKNPDGSVEFEIETIPGDFDRIKIHFRQINGEWRIDT